MNYIEQSDLERSKETLTRDMEREQAGDYVDRLEAELKGLEAKMLTECNGCHPGYVRCKDHADIALEIADRKRLINEIDQKYGK